MKKKIIEIDSQRRHSGAKFRVVFFAGSSSYGETFSCIQLVQIISCHENIQKSFLRLNKASNKPHEPHARPQSIMPLNDNKGQNPLTFATSTLGNAAGGVAKTAGGIVGAAGRGVGETVTGVTGNAGKPVGDALQSVGNGVEGGAKNLGDGVEDAGKGK